MECKSLKLDALSLQHEFANRAAFSKLSVKIHNQCPLFTLFYSPLAQTYDKFHCVDIDTN
ncbi:hypothetical protein HORM4_490045 [Vibrio harveyi]|nr:hypothetical protein HORM4_490045 [Vibrio harveyi]